MAKIPPRPHSSGAFSRDEPNRERKAHHPKLAYVEIWLALLDGVATNSSSILHLVWENGVVYWVSLVQTRYSILHNI